MKANQNDDAGILLRHEDLKHFIKRAKSDLIQWHNFENWWCFNGIRAPIKKLLNFEVSRPNRQRSKEKNDMKRFVFDDARIKCIEKGITTVNSTHKLWPPVVNKQ